MPVYPDQAYADTRDTEIAVHAITAGDVSNALRKGSADFWRHPSHYLFVALIYPVVGIVLAVWSAGGATFPLLYPLATGFALLGPIAALGLYELSRRRERGEDDNPRYALEVVRHPANGAMIAVGLWLAILFAFWIAAAGAIYEAHFAVNPPETLMALVTETFTTPRGWGLLLWGNLVGFGQSRPDDRLGRHRGREPVHRLDPAVRGSGPGAADSRPRYLAPLPQDHRLIVRLGCGPKKRPCAGIVAQGHSSKTVKADQALSAISVSSGSRST